MITLFITALIMGAVGTFHCIGMCGPLALALPVVTDNSTSRFFSTLLYNLGRVTTYSILGAFFGIAGSSIAFFGYQQGLSVTLGIVIIIFILLPKKIFARKNMLMRIFEKIRASLGKLFIRKNYHSVYFIGLLNGLLPCGLVYLAIAGAISTGSVLKSSLFMAAFGLGTLPVMWSIAFFGGFISIRVRQGIKKLYPYVMFAMAVLLIIRGLGLNIPYLSPSVSNRHHGMDPYIECHD